MPKKKVSKISTTSDVTLEFDIILKISVESLSESYKVSQIKDESCSDSVPQFVEYLVTLFKRILGKRVILIQCLTKLSDDIDWPSDDQWLTFGILIDVEHAYNNIERGPSGDSPDARQFRDLWGEKSELRRFQDNSICEAVYWNTKTFADKRKIIANSLEYVLSNILDISEDSIFTTTSLLDPILERNYLKFADKTVYGTGEELSLLISQQFDSLAKMLRTLDMALTITTVEGIDSVLRDTDVFPPLAMNSGVSDKHMKNCNIFDVSVEQNVKYFKPIEVVIHLEESGKWPNNLDAFLRVKASFYLEISQKLSKEFGILSYPTTDHIDIFHNGWIFRIIIGSHKELILMRHITTTQGLVKQINSPEADQLETKTEILPKINSSLRALSRTHLSYGTTSRLAKRWIASQMLSLYFDDMAIDLMVAHIFSNPSPYTVPNSPFVGFLRFLSLICDHNWRKSPLILDFNNNPNDQMSVQISEIFKNSRSEYPLMFITTTFDKQLSQWTRLWPDSVLLKRLQVLATAAKQTLVSQLENPSEIDPKTIFRPDLEIYDLVITLKSDQITNKTENIDFPQNNRLLIKKFDKNLNNRMPIIDFDSIGQYLQQLIQYYSQFALFFYDKYGGHQIGVLWKPSIFKTKTFNASELNGVRMSNTSDKSGLQNVVTNIEALIEDFSILGEGIVYSVDIKTQNWDKYQTN